MAAKPSYEKLEQSIKKLENEVVGRKRAEEALRETRDYLENLFNYANAPIIVWDTEAKITRFNHACEHLTGFTADEVIGQELHILFPEASREESLSKIASTLSGEYWESVEIPTLHKTGDIRTALWNSANICAEDGTTVVATIAQGQDITERKRAEERIKHLNSVLRSIRNVNQLITREKNRERLIQRTCEELFETRGCHSAWIVLMDESHKVFTSAETGLGQKFSLISEGLERGQLTPCCKRAVTQEGVVTIEDPLSNCRDCPVSQMYEGSGALAMRLQHGGKIYGVLVISVSSDFVTDKEEHALFAEVAGDIAFALHSIKLEERHKQAEAALRKSEQRFRQIYNNAEVGLAQVSLDFRIKNANKAYCKMLGYSEKELIGKHLRDITHPETIEDNLRRQEQLARGKIEHYRMEKKFIHKLGHLVFGLLNANLIRDAKGAPKYFLGSVVDITSRKQAEEALRVSEEKYRTLIERTSEGWWLIDAERKTLDVNQSLCDMLGYTREEMIGKTPLDFVDEKNQRIFEAQMAQIKSTPHRSYEIVLKGGTGKNVCTHFSATTIWDEPGRPQGSFALITDVTERKRLEAQLQQAERMEAIGTLAGGIAHDFNNLLMAAQGNVSLMLYDIDSTHPHYELLKNIEKQIKSGATLTRQFLGYARKGKYDVKPINLNEIMEETSDAFGRTRKDTTIHRELAEDLFAVEADQAQTEQVLLNLYVNATDAMPGGGNLTLKTMNVTHGNIKGKLYDPKPGNYVLLTVTDAGAGMDKETQERIFDPFFTTKEMGRGTGLGLASVYGIIKGHGGYIDVESEIGHGTTFSIYLPATEKKVEKTVVADKQIIKGTETVMVVDDEAMVLDAAVKVLKRLGYTVLEAKSGREAVKVYEENKDTIDMVFLDMIMPDMGGGKAYDRMKEINPKVKVLLSSGYSIESEAKKILACGCDGFIQKPFSLSELSQRVREILDKE